MEDGNEKSNTELANESGSNCGKQQRTWRTICGEDQRFFFVNLETDNSQWIPPADLWSSKLGLPYGWEAAISANNIKYFINHVQEKTTLEDPRSEADQAIQLRMAAQRSRKVQIVRDPAMGFGFVAGSEKPVVIRSVIPDGPSNGKLFSNDQILRVNGEDVSDVPQERVINLIKSCSNNLEMHVVSSEDLQDAKNQGNRRSSLMSRATRERRRSSPVNVRFADDIVQYIGPAEQARRSSLPVIPNVLKVYLENGQTRSFQYNQKTMIQEIFISLGQKIGIKSMEYFSLVLSGPQKNQMSLVQNHEKVADVYLNRNCSRSSWVCKLRVCFLQRNPMQLFDDDPVAFNYLYDQISKDVVEGHYGSDLRYDLAIKLAALHMQQKATQSKNKIPAKITVKTIEKDFDGLHHFIPEDIIKGVKMKDLRKVLDQQIKFNQSLATIGQRYLSSDECKKQYLKEAKDLMSYGGKYFKVILYSYDQSMTNGTTKNDAKKPSQQEATLLVSPRYGLSQMVKGEVNVLCQVADLDQITDFSIAYHTEGKRLLTISSKESKDTMLIMKPLDSMDLVTFITGYQKLWKKQPAKLKVIGDTQEPLAPLTDSDIPPYAFNHRVFPDSWSYPSFLQVPGNHSGPNFFVDLSKNPSAVNEKPIDEAENASQPLKRPSDIFMSDINNGQDMISSDVPEKRSKFENSVRDESVNNEDQSRGLYSISEEVSNNDEEDKDDYISQLTFTEIRDQKLPNVPSHSNNSDDARTLMHNAETGRIAEANDKIDDDSEGSVREIDSSTMAASVEHNDINLQNMESFYDGQFRSDPSDQSKENEVVSDDQDISSNMLGDGDAKEDQIKGEFLDINDIDFDDRSSDGPSVEMRTSLADFSFAGELFKPDMKSSTESLTIDEDVGATIGTVPTGQTSELEKMSLAIDHSSKSDNVEDITCVAEETSLNPITPKNVTIENKYFSKNLHVDELDSILQKGQAFTKHNEINETKENSSAKIVAYDVDLDDTDYNEDEETGIKLLSYTHFGDEKQLDSKPNTMEQDSEDSDISSLASRDSTKSDSYDDSKLDVSNKNSMIKRELPRQNASSARAISFFHDKGVNEMVENKMRQERVNSNVEEWDEINDTCTHTHREGITSNTSDVPGTSNSVFLSVHEGMTLSANFLFADTLILGSEPGESDDTPVVTMIGKQPSEEKAAPFVDDQDFSLMNWIIPPPPGSTRELQESDISVASPPPVSPNQVSSPPVELYDFDGNEIDGLVVPPPPLGQPLSKLIKIVSPPPSKQKTFNKILERSTCDSNGGVQADVNTKKMGRLSLNDDQPNEELFLPQKHIARHLHSSESSGSQSLDFDSDSANYSESIVSFYSISNDSQMTSEDELFEKDPTSIPSEKVNESINKATIMDLSDIGTQTLAGTTLNTSDRSSKLSLGDKIPDESKFVEVITTEDQLLSSQNEILDLLDPRPTEPRTYLTNGIPLDDYDSFDEVADDDKRLPVKQSMAEKSRLADSKSFSHSVIQSGKDGITKPVVIKPVEVNRELENDFQRGLQETLPTMLAVSDANNDALGGEDGCNVNAMSNDFPEYLLQQSANVTKRSSSSILNFEEDGKDADKDSDLRLQSLIEKVSKPNINAFQHEGSSSDSDSLASTAFPGYLLQSSKEKVIAKGDACRSDSSSIEFAENEYTTDEEFASSVLSKPNDKLILNIDKVEEDESESGQSVQSNLETKELAERLKLRIQGCVEDCKQAVLKSTYSPHSNNSKWKEAVQNNARSFASDIKSLNTIVQEMNSADVEMSVKSSQDTLQRLVGSFVMASSAQSRISLYNIRILAGILNDVICLYVDIIKRTDEAVRLFPLRDKCKDVSVKTSAMSALIASLSRTLKRL